jgi:hypothetical protein
MARKKKKRDAASKARRAALKGFAAKGEAGFPGRMQSEKAELVFEDGRNFKVGAGGTYSNPDIGATAADNAGYGLMYMNGILYTTRAGRARIAQSSHIEGTTLDLTTSEQLT